MIIRKRYRRDLQANYPILNADRYSQFDDLRKKLLMTFPNANGAMPPLPPKSLICRSRGRHFWNLLMFDPDKFRPDFLEKRRIGLAYFLKYDDCLRLSSKY